jgi:predicted tellurium resistance membrane protein TerC
MEAMIALVALTAMEIVLGIDNIVFIAVLTGRLPPHQQPLARQLGLGLALVTRILLLFTLTWLLGLQEPFLHLSHLGLASQWLESHPEVNEISWRDVILLSGGLFLISKSVVEIHERIEGHVEHRNVKKQPRFAWVLVQVALLDIVFSLDSVITAVGMANQIWVMVTAVIVAIGIMLIFAGAVSRFVEHNPTLKMLALSFLMLIGVMLVAEGIGTAINKGYIYFAMAFALAVEMLNLRVRALRGGPQGFDAEKHGASG